MHSKGHNTFLIEVKHRIFVWFAMMILGNERSQHLFLLIEVKHFKAMAGDPSDNLPVTTPS